MEKYSSPELPYYSTMGILFTILPYYGKQEAWGKLLLPICRKAKSFWDANQEALNGLAKKTKWRDPDSIKLANLYSQIFSRDVIFNEEFRLHLDLYEETDIEFLEKASAYKCPKYKELEVLNVCEDSQ